MSFLKFTSQFKYQMKQNAFFQKCYCKFYNLFWQKQLNSPVQLFFLAFIYSHVCQQWDSTSNTYIQSLLPLFLLITLNINIMYITAAFIRLPNIAISFIIFLITLTISCNQKWKTYLLLFLIGDTLARSFPIHSIYLFISSALFSNEIYNSLIFGTINDNRKCFIGFSATAVFGIIRFIQVQFLNISINPIIVFAMVFLAGYHADKLFCHKISKLAQSNIDQIKDSRIFAFYLIILQKEISINYKKYWKISTHRKKCTIPSCFCHIGQKTDDTSYLRQLYENSMNLFSQSKDPLLYQFYINFLLKNDQLISVIYFVNEWKPTSYFSLNSKLKSISNINRILADLNNSNKYEKEYSYALKYDQLLLEMTLEIYQIIEMKIAFWQQTTKQNPLMIKLQRQGLKIVDKMYRMNVFYSKKIKQYEKKLYSFEITILYAMYLLSTTNFKEYAQLIIKNTSKIIEEVHIIQNSSSSQTYLIKSSIQKDKYTFLKDKIEQFQIIQNQLNQLISTKPKFNLFIEDATNNFCKLIKMDKQNLIGLNLNQLVPNCYRQIYTKYLTQLLSFQNEKLPQIIPYKSILTSTKIPIKVSSNQLAMLFITFKPVINYQRGNQFIAIVKKIKNKSIRALVTFEGQLQEKEQGFNEQIMKHSEMEKYIQQIKAKWNEEKIIKEEQFNIMINGANFFIIINSPLCQLFSKVNAGNPPLHIEIINESSNKNKNNDAKNQHENLVNGIKNIQNAINYDSQSSTSSKSRTVAINVLSTFSQKNTVPIYRKIIIGFVFVITCCLVVSLVGFTSTNLQWDNTDKSNNPFNDTIDFMKMQHLSTLMLSNLMDIQEFYSNPSLNKTSVQRYFCNKANYSQTFMKLFSNKFKQFKKSLYKCLHSPSSLLDSYLNNRFNLQFTVYNMSVIPSSISFQQQNLTFAQILINYLTDFSLMSKGVIDNSITLSLTFTQDVIEKLKPLKFAQIIDASIDRSRFSNRVLTICMGVLILIFTIPMFFFLKSRLPMHQKIFDLFASIQPDMITKQMNSLSHINNIIKNYTESSQILKTNLISYQEKAIYPRNQSSRLSSASNQFILGLQKFDKTDQLISLQEIGFKQSDRVLNQPLKNTKIRNSYEKNPADLKQLVQAKKSFEKRRRAGDLDFTGSQSDPQSKINTKHTVLYIMTLIFLVFLTLQAISADNYTQTIKNKKNNLFNFTDIYTSAQLNFILGKIYFRFGDGGLQTIDPAYRLQYLEYIVQSTPIYDFVNSYGYDKQYPSCSKDTRLVCSNNYSYLTLIGEFGNLMKQLFEARYTADQNYNNYVSKNQSIVYAQIITNISQKTFYMQSILNQLQNIAYAIFEQIYIEMRDYSQSVNQYKFIVFIGSVCWWVVTVIVGTIFILGMKRQYFKEVYMLTFLNNEMIMNNKRVQSFIDSINKTSSN